MRILIVKLGAIGDVLRTTSVLGGLKERYPEAEIDWLTSTLGREVLLNNPLISRLFTWEERTQTRIYDLAIGLEDEPEACEMVSQTNAGQILGAYLEKGKVTYTPSAWFDMSAISKYGLDTANELKRKNRKTYQQHLAEMLGIQIGPYLFMLSPDEQQYGRQVIKDLGLGAKEKLFGINTGAGPRWQFKSLSVEKTIELVKRIKNELGIASLILGGEQEKERNKVISKETGMPDAGRHSLRQFAGIIDQCRLLVGSDSLALHFGIALKKRLVAFFGPTSHYEIELYGLGTKVLPPVDCLVCYRRQCGKQPNCMEEISVDDLFAAVKREVSRL